LVQLSPASSPNSSELLAAPKRCNLISYELLSLCSFDAYSLQVAFAAALVAPIMDPVISSQGLFSAVLLAWVRGHRLPGITCVNRWRQTITPRRPCVTAHNRRLVYLSIQRGLETLLPLLAHSLGPIPTLPTSLSSFSKLLQLRFAFR